MVRSDRDQGMTSVWGRREGLVTRSQGEAQRLPGTEGEQGAAAVGVDSAPLPRPERAPSAAPRTLPALEPLMACLPWRLHAYGPAVLASLWGVPPSTE